MIPHSQLLRVRQICSTLELFDENAIEMVGSFSNRWYPSDLVGNTVIKAQRIDREKIRPPTEPIKKTEKLENKMYLIATYNSGKNIQEKIINKHLPYLIKNPYRRAFDNLDIVQALRWPKKTPKYYLVRASPNT